MIKRVLYLLAAAIAFVSGLLIAFRVLAPVGIQADPDDQGYCEKYGIQIDDSSIGAIYGQPEQLLADPEAFLSRDAANLMLSKTYAESNKSLNVKRWLRQVKKISKQDHAARDSALVYRFSVDVLAGQETFCKLAVPHLLAYLPKGADLSATYYLHGFDAFSGETIWSRIVIAMSHPLYVNTERFLGQGESAIFNIMTHELFHRGYNEASLWHTEFPLENSVVQSLIGAVQNEGMATYTAYRITENYPASLEINYTMQNVKPYVRYWIGRMNEFFETADGKTETELYRDVQPLYTPEVFYTVGLYMAGQIEEGLGREALRATVVNGPQSFVRAYNSVAEDGLALSVDFTEASIDPLFKALRTAALAGNLPVVRQSLEDIQKRQALSDFEREGQLLYNSAYVLLDQGEFALAEEIFYTLIGYNPQVASLYIGLGDVYAEMGDTGAAIENYQKAMEQEERFGWVAILIDELERERVEYLKE